MTEERDDIVVLIDESGEEVEFEYLDTIEMNEQEYVVLVPAKEESDDDGTDEVVILKIEHGANGEDSFITIEDDDEANAVFEEFQARWEEDEEEQ